MIRVNHRRARALAVFLAAGVIGGACTNESSSSDDTEAADSSTAPATTQAESSEDTSSTEAPTTTQADVSDDGSGSAAEAPTTAPQADPDDVIGVDDTSVKLAWIVPDTEALQGTGFVPELDIAAVGQAIVDGWNADGGIAGHTIDLVVAKYDALGADPLAELQRVCLELTEDEQVFAGITPSFYGDALTCFSGTHKTPLLTSESDPQSVLDTTANNVFVANFTWERALQSMVQALDSTGKLDPSSKIAVYGVDEVGMQPAIDNALLPALAAVGIEPADVAVIPFSGTGEPDPAAVAAVVTRFKDAGIDTVIPLGNLLYNAAFMGMAEEQGFHPVYFVSDLSEGTSDLVGRFEPATQLENAVGVSWQPFKNEPLPTEATQQCADQHAPGGAPDAQILAASICDLFQLARLGLDGAAQTGGITRTNFVAALEGVTEFETRAGTTGGFGPDKHDLPDSVRLVTFDAADCTCWVPEGDWLAVGG